jgi:hypothetical protein
LEGIGDRFVVSKDEVVHFQHMSEMLYGLIDGQQLVVVRAECCHLVGEVLDMLQKYNAVVEWGNGRKRQLGCALDDVVCTEGCGIQVASG